MVELEVLCGAAFAEVDAWFAAAPADDVDVVLVEPELELEPELDASSFEDGWLVPPAQSPVGIPQPFPPAIGHQDGSCSFGDQSVIGIST